jgi:hypothetical protein
MIPGRIEGATHFLGAPAGWEEERDGHCGTLPVVAGVNDCGVLCMQSCWEPTPAEIERINAGAMVTLTIIGRAHPPVALEVAQLVGAD